MTRFSEKRENCLLTANDCKKRDVYEKSPLGSKRASKIVQTFYTFYFPTSRP